jgi:hypothetical protein
LPKPITKLFQNRNFAEAELLFAVAEHKVKLAGRGHDSQCDVWAMLNTSKGAVSLTVEAKANEPFGQDNETLAEWLGAERSEQSQKNRQMRWDYIRKHLPSPGTNGYSEVAYQLLHRCAAAVIEARRFRLSHAAFLVQSFNSPKESFNEYVRFCVAIGIRVERGQMQITSVEDVRLGIGWADCPLATDKEVAAVV